jgi:Response regulator containing CheY-like receiver, AAA-type ATPase, and DNA-binding domains
MTMDASISAHILVVEDNRLYREAFCTLLDICFPGVRITAVSDGTAALSLTRHTPFDLIVVDYNLKTLNGGDVVRHLRQRSRSTGILLPPIVMMSTQPDVAVFARTMGATDFLSKPVSEEDIQAIIRPLLADRNCCAEQSSESPPSQTRERKPLKRLKPRLDHQ